jgi:hypothetical protein
VLLSSEVTAPGGTGEIKTEYKIKKSRSGTFRKSIRVYSNDPAKPKVLLYLNGSVEHKE